MLQAELQTVEAAMASWPAALRSSLSRLDDDASVRPGIADDVVRYVMRGEPASMVAEAGQSGRIATVLGVFGYGHRSEAQSRELFGPFATLPAAVALRWAQLVAAAATSKDDSGTDRGYAADTPWPEIFMMYACGIGPNVWSSNTAPLRFLPASQFEAMLALAGQDPATLLTTAFTPREEAFYGSAHGPLLAQLAGYARYVHRHVTSIVGLLPTPGVPLRLHRISLLQGLQADTLAILAPELAELATGSAGQVRAACEPLLQRAGVAARAPLETIARDGKADQRVLALRLLWKMAADAGDSAMADKLRSAAAHDKAAAVKALVQAWGRDQLAVPAMTSALPVVDPHEADCPAVEQAVQQLREIINAGVDRENALSRAHHAQASQNGTAYRLLLRERLDERVYARLRSCVAGHGAATDSWDIGHHAHPPLMQFSSMQGVVPLAFMRAAAFLRTGNTTSQLNYTLTEGFNAMHAVSARPSLLEVQQVASGFGYSAEAVLNAYCHTYGSLARDWPDQAIVPFFMHNIELVNRYLASPSLGDYSFDRNVLFRALGKLPALSSSTVDVLFALALGSAKMERAVAQQALSPVPGKEARIVAALANGKAEVRQLAAHWLARLAHRAALPAVEAALAKEKNDLAKGAMLDALTAFGQPIEKYFDRTALLQEAKKALAKGMPKEIDWFPWASLPVVRWKDGAEPVDPLVLQFMLVQAVKQKSPSPNAVLRKFSAMFDPVDREQFGQFVLDAWIAQDTLPITPEQAQEAASKHAQAMHDMVRAYPQYFPGSPMLNQTVDEIRRVSLPSFLLQPAGSAIASKGLLALAAACAAGRATATAGRYLKQFYGTRAAHGRALIAMLAWVDHPSATQLVLAVGNRFRTKSFQEEAMLQVAALAERRGWTVAELADRTMPSAGFDEQGELLLNFGQRVFSARLQPDFKIALFNPDGHPISDLPEPRMDDDAAMAKSAKQALIAARKELKAIVKAQSDRLYEALCIERDWTFDDWSGYLFAHPVVRHLVQRLVWARRSDDGSWHSFRPLDDGTLTDLDDQQVTLAPQDRVRLAHDSMLDAATGAAWIAHLLDYQTLPLFRQFGRGQFAAPAKAQAISDFEGHMIDALALRGRAVQLGYTRGSTEDGGWFYTYEKRFMMLGLVAQLHFTGSPLPEEKREVALQKLIVRGLGQQGGMNGGGIALAELPSVLLSECYSDLRDMADAGKGFDPAWESKTGN
jgi:hypothetical protein